MRNSKKEPFARLEWDRNFDLERPPATLKRWSCVNSAGTDSPHQPEDSRIILGENLAVMNALLPAYSGKIDLIYADPPFLSGKMFTARVGQGEDSRKPGDWETTTGYRDTWNNGSDYLNMLYPRLQRMYELLSDEGTLYLHLDWHASAYARVILDEIFGRERLINELIWVYHGPSPIRSAFKRKHDTILVYTKSKNYTFNADDVRVPYSPSTLKTFASSSKAGFGKVPDLKRGKVPEDWWYFPVVARLHSERTGYPTQKPEALLERIIRASSNPGALVADFFCGSGTTATVAERLERKWIACDQTELAVHTTYRRLLQQVKRPFSFDISEQMQLQPGFSCRFENVPEGRTVNIHVAATEPGNARVQLLEADWQPQQDGFTCQDFVVADPKGKHPLAALTHTFTVPGEYLAHLRATDQLGRIAQGEILLIIPE